MDASQNQATTDVGVTPAEATPIEGPNAEPRTKDEGSVLVLTMVFMIVGALIVVPLMNYAIVVMRANHVLSEKTQKIEAAKAGLRLALSDPVSLYERCGEGGPTVPVRLASPTLTGRTVTSNCYYVNFATAQAANEQRLGLVTTLQGAQPPQALKGTSYVPSSAATNAWVADTTTASTTGKIWLPNLPVHALTRRAAAGYQMPAGYPTCRVFFPGTYTDPITLTGPTYFTSGIYYFENTVTVNGGASVVAGMGVNAGCSDDQESAFYAVNAPATHNINGLGATFVFGAAGRLVVSNANNSPVSLVFNQRYVAPNDEGAAPSQGVSIITVNGNATGTGPLDVADTNYVPLSLVGTTGGMSAVAQDYLPSSLTAASVPAPAPAAPAAVWTPVVQIDASRNVDLTVDVPGYVSMPQGILDVQNPQGKTVRMAGGVLVASFQIVDGRAGNPARSQSVDIGFLDSVVQRTFRIVSTVDNITSTAVVQVNQNGAYAVNSWEVQ